MALVALTFFFAGLVKGVLGLGLPVVVTALLAATIGLKTALSLMLVPALVMNTWQGLTGGGFVELLRRLWPMFAMAIVFIWIGAGMLAASDGDKLLGLLGIVLMVYAVTALVRPQVPPPRRWEPILSPLVGMISGTLFGMVGNFMVPGVMYIQSLGLGRDRLVQALGMTFLTISLAMLLAMTYHALINRETIFVSVGAMVPAVAGMAVGQRLRPLLSEDQFRVVFLVGLFLTALYMFVRAQIV